MNKIEQTKEKLDSVSPSFCLAKWKQVTIHLQTGMTHSCHHPATHKIPLDELQNNPSALHNTNFKKLQRKKMLEGVRPSECDYCWKIEDTPGNNYSDRHFKSNANWAEPHLDDIKTMPWDANIYPSYLEVSFSHACNFKCSYCSPNISSKWTEEIKQFGAYPTSTRFNNLEWLQQTNQMPIPLRDHNPYIEAFWKWWPEVYPHLKVFRITGGEPLLSKETFRVLDWFIKNPNPNLEFAVNTNLGVLDDLLDKFIEKMKIITDKGLVANPKIFTSIEGWGDRASYVRYNMNFDHFWSNVERILTELPKCNLTFMCTFNALSVTSFADFLRGALMLKNKYSNRDRPSGIFVDVPYLRFPSHQSAKILTPDYLEYMEEIFNLVKLHSEDSKKSFRGFHDFEIMRVKRIYDWMKEPEDKQWLKINRADFYRFFNEYDKRRNLNFLETYPEMKEFWNLCKLAAGEFSDDIIS